METITLLQHYWWLIISLLGALLVFLLFVQGGQGLLYCLGRTEEERNMLVNSLGRKWEFTFTTLVTFGGAFFASFPLFYSTSFGGAYYVWMTILLSFVIQPVAYQFRRKAGNVFGEKTFDVFLTINGIAGPLLLGTAVGTLFTGANFTVDRLNLANGAGSGSATVISQWTTPWHGLEALGDMRNVALGLAVMFLAGMLACQYFMNNIADETLFARARRRMLTLAAPFLVFFLTFFVWLLFSDGLAVDAAGRISAEPYKYLHNMLEMPYVAAALLFGLARKTQCRLVRRRGHRADGTGPAAVRRMEQHGLLPVAGGDAVVADDLQLVVERIHAQSDERRLADDPVRRSLYLVRMAGHEPQADHPRRDTRERPYVLTRKRGKVSDFPPLLFQPFPPAIFRLRRTDTDSGARRRNEVPSRRSSWRGGSYPSTRNRRRGRGSASSPCA